MGSNDRALQHVVLIWDVANRLEQESRVLDEGEPRTQRKRVLHNPIPAIPDNQGNTHRANQVNQRKKHRVIKNRIDVRFAMFVVDFSKPPWVLRWMMRHSAFSFSDFEIARWINSAVAGLIVASMCIDTTVCAVIASGKRKVARCVQIRFKKMASFNHEECWNALTNLTKEKGITIFSSSRRPGVHQPPCKPSFKALWYLRRSKL